MNFVVYCDGGLGNRLNSLIGGIILSKLLGLKPTISWPANRWCDCRFDSLFSHDLSFNDDSITKLAEKYPRCVLVSHDSTFFQNTTSINPNSVFFLGSLLKRINMSIKSTSDIIYYDSTLPAYFSSKDVKTVLSMFSVKADIQTRAHCFLNSTELGKMRFLGLHLRGTDANFSARYYKTWYYFIKYSRLLVLLCTDDEQIERTFSTLPNVRFRKKNEYSARAVIGEGWNFVCEDEYGRSFNYNVKRSEIAVSEALVDMCLLSKSILIFTSRSTFLRLALHMRGERSFFIERLPFIFFDFTFYLRAVRNAFKRAQITCDR